MRKLLIGLLPLHGCSCPHFWLYGSYFLDRDGGAFRHVLAYLRGEQHLLAGKALQAAERLQLLHEARYFQASPAQL